MGQATDHPADACFAHLRERFLGAMRLAGSGVSIVTARMGGALGSERCGATVSALCSLTVEPPSVLVCINRASHTAGAIRESGAFCANLLSDEQIDLAELFAGRAASGEARFRHGRWGRMVTGSPALEGSLAAFDCELASMLPFGSHYIFVGQVQDVRLGEGRPLLYCDRSYGRIDKTLPKSVPVTA
ncbi:flavin reductase family protein [Pseudochelatococcus sp. B33]